MNKKNVAIFYDIENLVGGYSLKYLSEISLKNILLELNKMGFDNIAIQKAYADWSNIALNSIKWDISELGIDPIQMYGFSKAMTKNASDIQLVIDVMEVLHTKDFIDTFVIVSGDGGFASLAKKISEYGKRVIGCAYKRTANEIFTKVCDKFIFIDDILTREQLDKIKELELEENKKKAIIENPILKQILPDMPRINNYDLDLIEENVKKFINKLKSNALAIKVLKEEGINISIFKNALDYLFDGFDYNQFGFAKLTDFIRYVLKDTDLKLVLKEPSEYRIVFKNINLPNFVDVEYIYKKPEIHSKENYIKTLSYRMPIIKLPENKENFLKVLDYMIENRNDFLDVYYPNLFEKLEHLNIDKKELTNILYFLIYTKNLIGDNTTPYLKEQNFYFSPLDRNEAFSNIKEAMINKILSVYGVVDENEIDKIIEELKGEIKI